MYRTVIGVCVLVVLAVAQVYGGQVVLKNGDRLTGTILKADEKSVVLKSDFAGTVTIQFDAVAQIVSEETLHLNLKDGQVVVGTVQTKDGKLEVETPNAGRVTFEKAAVVSLRSREEQEAYLAELERLRNPGLLDLWSGSTDIGLSLTGGNAETTTFSLSGNAARTSPRDKIGVYVASLYATNSTTGSSLTTANAIRGGARYDLNISRRHFAFGMGDLEFDEFQKLDLRAVIGGGMGWRAVRTDTTSFDLFGGGSMNKEYFSTGLKRTSGEALVGQELTHRLSGRTTFRERMVFLPNLSDTGEFRMNFDASAVTRLSTWLGWHVTFSNRYLSNPVQGTKKNDVLLTTGLRITFEK